MRILKVNNLIKQELGRILEKEARFEGIMISVSQVNTSQNLRQARVSLSIFPFNKSQEIFEKIAKRTGFLQGQLHHKLYMKPLPKISFILDNSQQQARRVSEILEEDEREREEI